MIRSKRVLRYQNTLIDIDESHSAKCGEFLLSHFYNKQTVSSHGCHLHVWIPENCNEEGLKYLLSRARNLWDILSYSWDYYQEDNRKICGIEVHKEEVKSVVMKLSSMAYLQTNLMSLTNGTIEGLELAYKKYGSY